jgi:hypothetical protein
MIILSLYPMQRPNKGINSTGSSFMQPLLWGKIFHVGRIEDDGVHITDLKKGGLSNDGNSYCENSCVTIN